MDDFSLGYESGGEHHGLGVGLSNPPDSFTVREHLEDGTYIETVYVLKRTCKMDVIATGENAFYEGYERIFHCRSCGAERAIYAFNEDGDAWSEMPKFCSECGSEVIDD